jgi:hypothetical protein
MFAGFDDPAGKPEWKEPVVNLSLGAPVVWSRWHIRIFQSPLDSSHPSRMKYGQWSIAAVHLEHFSLRRGHVVDDWQEAQVFLEWALQKVPFVTAVELREGKGRGDYQSVPFDGMVTWVRLME